MKTLITIIAITLGIASSYAQTKSEIQISSVEILVGGKCGMCKSRIEKIAKVEGVSKADWSLESKKLSLNYNPKLVDLDDLQKKIAAAGHDTENYKADDKVYKSLPACCKYERLEVKVKSHKH